MQKSIEIGKSLILSAPRELNESRRTSVKIYLHKYCDFFQRTLVKSHKVFQKDSPKAVLEKSWSEKFHKKFTQKRLLWSPFFSYLTTCNFTEKEPHHSYFPMTFEKIFQNTVLCQNTGKATEGTEVFDRICFSKKLIWRISQNSPKRNYDGVIF